MKRKVNVVKELWWYFRDDKLMLFIALFSAISAAILLGIGSISIGIALIGFQDYVLPQGNLARDNDDLIIAFSAAGFSVGIYMIYSLMQTLIYKYMIFLSHKTGSRIRERIFQNIMRLSISYFDKKKTGQFISRTTNDIDQLVINLSEAASSSFAAPFVVTFASVIMLLISPILSTIYFIFLPLVIASAALISKTSIPHFIDQQKKLETLNGNSLEILENQHAVYFLKKQKKVYDRFAETNEDYMKDVTKGEYKIALVWPSVDALENIMYGIVFVIGAVLLGVDSQGVFGNLGSLIPGPLGDSFSQYDSINFGLIASIISFARIVNGEIGNLARISSLIQKVAVTTKRAAEIINEKPEIDEGTIQLENIKGDVDFCDIKFGYDEKHLVIRDFNLHVKSGTRVAIVGPTGCGKTTISQLLLRFYDVDSGMIKLDGIDIKTISKESLSKLIAIVFQDSRLFSVSIDQNIRYGTQRDLTTEDVKNAAIAMDAEHFINLYPEGFSTVINDKLSLSTGQTQLLTLARAYVNNSKILILDEATSSIDTKTEREVQKGMAKLMTGKTSFVIAHRLSTIINSDLIVVMKEGRIVETGKHKDLLAKKGFYADLYNAKITENE